MTARVRTLLIYLVGAPIGAAAVILAFYFLLVWLNGGREFPN